MSTKEANGMELNGTARLAGTIEFGRIFQTFDGRTFNATISLLAKFTRLSEIIRYQSKSRRTSSHKISAKELNKNDTCLFFICMHFPFQTPTYLHTVP